jgi:hypothetical protein
LAGRESQRRRRKRRRSGTAGVSSQGEASPPAAQPQAEQPAKPSKNDLARERLVPLRPDERPTAVTVAAVLAALLALSNIAGLVFGLTVEGSKPEAAPVLAFAAFMLVAAAGLWRSQYWAVLGFQTILGILIVLMSLLLISAQNLLAVAVAMAIIGGAGTLFWFLVKALARIQMPERPSG